MRTLSIDIETYSSAELSRTGVYRYCQEPDFEILLFGYSADGGNVNVVDFTAGEQLPDEVLAALTDNSVTKWGFNCTFERICISTWLRKHGYALKSDNYAEPDYLDPVSWRCTMVWSAYLGLPLSLSDVGAALGLEKQKLDTGKDLIRYFCKPCAPTNANGMRTRNMPSDSPEKWHQFKIYNERDVETEMEIKHHLAAFPVPEDVWAQYRQDQEINDRGILVDTTLVKNAIAMDTQSHEVLTGLVKQLTQLENPSSVQQMKQWLSINGMEVESLGKKQVAELIKNAPPVLRDVLSLRLQLSKSSVKKYIAMQNAVCSDNRIRGCFQFYGAARTGRYAGRLVQLHNLYRNSLPDLDTARELVRSGDYETVNMLYGSVPEVLSELIRTAFIAPEGKTFIVADFSAIEARVIAWLAREKWRMQLFHNNGDIYCQSASAMFHVPVEKHGINGHLRQKGKIAELACIAEGEPVLTDQGLVPIENVTRDMRVWDGETWVQHDGVVFRGEREVITYEGLTATPDHLVWVEGQSRPIQFGDAAARGAHLVQTGDGRNPVRLGTHHFSGKKMEPKLESLLCVDTVRRLPINSVAGPGESANRTVKWLSAMLPTETNTALVGETPDCCEATLREPERSRISQLWGTWNQICFCECPLCGSIPDSSIWTSESPNGNRPYRHEWRLCSRESEVCTAFGKLLESTPLCTVTLRAMLLAVFLCHGYSKTVLRYEPGTNYRGSEEGSKASEKKLEAHRKKVRVYDICNAGKHHRFTVMYLTFAYNIFMLFTKPCILA